jgi:hypothetical protein
MFVFDEHRGNLQCCNTSHTNIKHIINETTFIFISVVKTLALQLCEEFEDTKGVIRIRIYIFIYIYLLFL